MDFHNNNNNNNIISIFFRLNSFTSFIILYLSIIYTTIYTHAPRTTHHATNCFQTILYSCLLYNIACQRRSYRSLVTYFFNKNSYCTYWTAVKGNIERTDRWWSLCLLLLLGLVIKVLSRLTYEYCCVPGK